MSTGGVREGIEVYFVGLDLAWGEVNKPVWLSSTPTVDWCSSAPSATMPGMLGLGLHPYADAPRRAIEVYPHAASVAIFRLGRTLKYKPGRVRRPSIRAIAADRDGREPRRNNRPRFM
jgi:predicted RNase H-like nuclease